MKKYAIWKNKKGTGYIELTEDQRMQLNLIPEIGMYIGFDEVTDPGKYKKLMQNDIKKMYK